MFAIQCSLQVIYDDVFFAFFLAFNSSFNKILRITTHSCLHDIFYKRRMSASP